MDKIFPMKRKVAKFVKPIIEHTIKTPLTDERTFDEIEKSSTDESYYLNINMSFVDKKN